MLVYPWNGPNADESTMDPDNNVTTVYIVNIKWLFECQHTMVSCSTNIKRNTYKYWTQKVNCAKGQ